MKRILWGRHKNTLFIEKSNGRKIKTLFWKRSCEDNEGDLIVLDDNIQIQYQDTGEEKWTPTYLFDMYFYPPRMPI